MRRIALYSDIHGNVPALEAVLADIVCTGVTERYCLGDLVGYGPDPSGVIARVRATGDPVIPVDQLPESKVRAAFSKEVHGKSATAIAELWQQRGAAGATPPMATPRPPAGGAVAAGHWRTCECFRSRANLCGGGAVRGAGRDSRPPAGTHALR